MTIVKAPNDIPLSEIDKPRIFLAGSIDMGSAVDWQTRVERALEGYDIVVMNPRRDDWDASWVQEIENDQFREQVEWELDSLEQADLIIYYFDPAGAAPITLLELGLFANEGSAVICCPKGYWRKGNVDIVCKRYNIDQVDTVEELIKYAQDWALNRM